MIPGVSSPFGSLLAVLEASGSPAALERELEQAQQAGLLGESDAAAARRVQQSLIRSRRRENLLRVLLESSTDLTAITDFEEVLHAIVRRTRTLLGSDMAYISLNDYESHETYIHTTDGVATDNYRNIRMELGSGVLGKIAGGTAPAQSLDYSIDPELIHVPEIDRTVENEGVRSIMGAPMLRDGVLLGALMVAERYQRHFTAEEMWLVESMSSLASVALSNARLIGELQVTLRERDLLQSEREYEHLSIAADQQFERALMECVIGEDPYSTFLALIGDSAGAHAWILDSAGRQLHGPGSLEIPQRELSAAMTSSATTAKAHVFPVTSSSATSPLHYCLMSASAGSRALGAVLLRGLPDDATQRNLTRSGLILSVLLLIDETRFESDLRAQSELISSLIRPRADREANPGSRTARFGINLGRSVTVHAIDAVGEETRALGLLRALTDAAHGMTAIVNDLIVLVHPNNIADEALSLLASHGIVATVGIDTEPRFSGSLQQAFTFAERSLRALLALGMGGTAGSQHSLGVIGLLMHSANPQAVNAVVSDAIGPLLDYDAARQTQLVETVWAFFAGGRRHSETAAALHVHPNTLRQRLDRVGLILGENWTTPQVSSQLFLALQLHRLRS